MDKRMSRMAFFFTVLGLRKGTLFIKTIVYYTNFFLSFTSYYTTVRMYVPITCDIINRDKIDVEGRRCRYDLLSVEQAQEKQIHYLKR